jgi:cold shock protein
MKYHYRMTQTETNDVSPPVTTDVTSSFSSGRVKWFNNKAGYGFITVSSGDHEGSDVFVHHSAITVEHEQYRYLVQGEYVNFDLCQVEDDNHKWQAGAVKGINGGKLMCETRLESRESRMTRTSPGEGEVDVDRRPGPSRGGSYREDNAQHYRVRSRGTGPREGDEWMLVRRRAPKPVGASSPSKEVLRGRPTKTHNGGGNN